MNNAGITRILITDKLTGRGAYRFEESKPLQPAATQLYRETFDRLGMTLLPGDDELCCSKQEFVAGYDYKYGTDVFLRFASGMPATMQEKFLTTTFDTVTVEYYQDWRTQEEGDWFKLRVDYYFVGYFIKGHIDFRKWILLDWPATQRATAQGRISWQENKNMRDGARASFKYVAFEDIPDECVINRHPKPAQQQALDTLKTISGQKPRSVDWTARKQRAIEFVKKDITLKGYPYQTESDE